MTAPSSTTPFPYHSAQALGTALTERLKTLAATSRYNVSQLRRQFAYDRLLARLFTSPHREWILKGGVSMLARLSIARHSADVDLVADADSPTTALTALRTRAATDLGDFFTFQFDEPRTLVQGIQGIRVPTEAHLGPRLFERFGIDLVTGATITGPPENAQPLLTVNIPGLVRPDYRLYPLADSIADKVTAITEDHHGRPSTRFRDLVDIVLIAHDQPVNAKDLATALGSERLRRNLPPITHFDVPDHALWRAGYQRAVADLPELTERSLDQALAVANALIDPILSRQHASGIWKPASLTWE